MDFARHAELKISKWPFRPRESYCFEMRRIGQFQVYHIRFHPNLFLKTFLRQAIMEDENRI
jgi:uncharacterized membrane protein YfbV (UPF0208 family)